MNRRLVLVITIVAIICILFGVGIAVMGARVGNGLGNFYSSVLAKLPLRKNSKPELIVIDGKSDADNLRASAADALRQHGALPSAPPINESKAEASKIRPMESNDATAATATTEEKEVLNGENKTSSDTNRNTNPALPTSVKSPFGPSPAISEERAAMNKMWEEGNDRVRQLMREQGYIPDEELERVKEEFKNSTKESNDKSITTDNNKTETNDSTASDTRTTSGSVNPGKLGEAAVRIAKEYNDTKATPNNSPDLPNTTKPGEGTDNSYLVNPVLQVVSADRRNRGTLGSTSGQLGGANELTTIFDLRSHVSANGFIGRYTVNIEVGDYRGGYAPPMFNIKLVSLTGTGNAVDYRIDRLMWSRSVTGRATATFTIPATDTNQVGLLVSASSVDPRCNVSYSVQLSK